MRSYHIFASLIKATVCAAALLSCNVPWAAAAVAKALDTQRLASCSWDKPGHNPFMGDVIAAVDRYQDIAPEVRAKLKQRMAKRDYDDIADIRRDSLKGKHNYDPAIRDMHFGTNRVCGSVSRSAWSPSQHERGLVYCEGTQCIIVPTVCRNVSRVTRHEPRAVASAEAAAPEGELPFEPPAAGPVAAAAPEPALPGGGGGAAPATFNEGAGVPLVPGGISEGPGSSGPGPGPVGPGPYVPPIVIPGGPIGPVGPVDPIGPVGPIGPISQVPEPASWLMMLIGLVGAGSLARHQRRKAPAV